MAAFVLGTSMRRAGGRDCPSPSDAAKKVPRSQAAASHRHGTRVRRRSAPSRWPCPAPASEPTSPDARGEGTRPVLAYPRYGWGSSNLEGATPGGKSPSRRSAQQDPRAGEAVEARSGWALQGVGTRSRGRGRTCLEGGSVRPSLVVGRPCVPIAARTPVHTWDTAA